MIPERIVRKMAAAETILTSEFFYQFASLYDEDEPVREFMLEYDQEFYKHVVVNYKGLKFMDDLYAEQTMANATYAFALMGDALRRMFDAIAADYNPLENYFTDRTMDTDTDNTQTKTGNKDVQKTGQVASTQSGTKTRTYNNQTNTGQSTSFEDPVNFANVSKDTLTGNVQDTFTGYGSTTTYGTPSAPMSEKTVYDVKTEDEGGESVEEHRSGNSGIFAKQDLTQRELTLRQGNLFMKTAVRMLVDAFNAGVW